MEPPSDHPDLSSTAMHPILDSDLESLLDQHDQRVSRAEQVATLFSAGITDPDDLAMLAGVPRGYVLETLAAEAGTHAPRHAGTYESFFSEGFGVENAAAAEQSVRLLDTLYFRFGLAHDHAGQLATMQTALRLYNQARWAGHPEAAAVVHDWLTRSIENG